MDAQPKQPITAEVAIRRIQKLGAACKLAYLVLWEMAGGRENVVITSSDLLAAECGGKRRSADDWIDTLREREWIDDLGELRGGMRRFLVLDPRIEVRQARRPDPQRLFAEIAESEVEEIGCGTIQGEEEIRSLAMYEPDRLPDPNVEARMREDVSAPSVPVVAINDASLQDASPEAAFFADMARRQAEQQAHIARSTPQQLGEQIVQKPPPGETVRFPPNAKNAEKNGFGGNCAISPSRESKSLKTKTNNIESLCLKTERDGALIQPGGKSHGFPHGQNSPNENWRDELGRSIEAKTRQQQREHVAELMAAVPGLYEAVALTIVDGMLAGWLDRLEVQKKIAKARDVARKDGSFDPVQYRKWFLSAMKYLFIRARQPWPHGKPNCRPPDQ